MPPSSERARVRVKTMLHRFCPQLVVPSVTVLTADFFRQHRLTAALLDLDNTLVLWHGTSVDAAVADWIEELKAAGIRFCLASNTRRVRRLAAVGETLGVP